MNKTIKGLSGTIEVLKHRCEKKLDLINQSYVALSAQVQAMSQRLATVKKQGIFTERFPRRSTKT